MKNWLKKYPNEYVVIANLGTTYELMGNNEKALEYIKKGMKLNPRSHNGSEWIHVESVGSENRHREKPKTIGRKKLTPTYNKTKIG